MQMARGKAIDTEISIKVVLKNCVLFVCNVHLFRLLFIHFSCFVDLSQETFEIAQNIVKLLVFFAARHIMFIADFQQLLKQIE